ncbi:UNVERIFIED_CONTAM: hypothetical protein Sangu_2006900 [Sesamum angustifolium]|uniref:Reverse transcriptase zinc-binding domain-containing protein n=1 Tax=Sesamum angustifolium TaxID=2727405 RepID=A0AAW2LIU1_9LAMI
MGSGGGIGARTKLIGSNGTAYATANYWVVLASNIFTFSIFPCLQNNVGASCGTRIVFLATYFELVVFFPVRSAYHLACSLEDRPSSSSAHEHEQLWWRRVWQAKVPKEVKVFVWRACINALPIGEKLSRCIPDLSTEYPFCGCENEDRMHAFALCPFARQVWGLSPIPLSLTSVQIPDFWRNGKLMQGNCLESPHVPYFTIQLLNSFLSQNFGSSTGAGLKSLSHWAALPLGSIKVNFDWATFQKGLELGAGVIARYRNGAVVAWLSRRFNRASTAEIVEAMAVRELFG